MPPNMADRTQTFTASPPGWFISYNIQLFSALRNTGHSSTKKGWGGVFLAETRASSCFTHLEVYMPAMWWFSKDASKWEKRWSSYSSRPLLGRNDLQQVHRDPPQLEGRDTPVRFFRGAPEVSSAGHPFESPLWVSIHPKDSSFP